MGEGGGVGGEDAVTHERGVEKEGCEEMDDDEVKHCCWRTGGVAAGGACERMGSECASGSDETTQEGAVLDGGKPETAAVGPFICCLRCLLLWDGPRDSPSKSSLFFVLRWSGRAGLKSVEVSAGNYLSCYPIDRFPRRTRRNSCQDIKVILAMQICGGRNSFYADVKSINLFSPYDSLFSQRRPTPLSFGAWQLYRLIELYYI